MRRLHIRIDLPDGVSDDLRDAYTPAKVGWMIPVDENLTVDELARKVTESYQRRYPDFADKEPDLHINEIRDGYGCSLEINDSVGEVFESREKTADARNYTVHVVRGPLTVAEMAVIRGYESNLHTGRESPLPMESSVRILKRHLGSDRHPSPRSSQLFKRPKLSHTTYQDPSEDPQFVPCIEQDNAIGASVRQSQLLRTATPEANEDSGSEIQADASNHKFTSAPESLKNDSPPPVAKPKAPANAAKEKKTPAKKVAAKEKATEPSNIENADKPARKKPGPKKKAADEASQNTQNMAGASAKNPVASATTNGVAEPTQSQNQATVENSSQKKDQEAKKAEAPISSPSDQGAAVTKPKQERARKKDTPSKSKTKAEEGKGEPSQTTAKLPDDDTGAAAPNEAKKTKKTETKQSQEAPAKTPQTDVDMPDASPENQEAAPKRKKKEPTPWYPGKPGRPPNHILEARKLEQQNSGSQETASPASKAKDPPATKAKDQVTHDETPTAPPAKEATAKKTTASKPKAKKTESKEETATAAPKPKQNVTEQVDDSDTSDPSSTSDSNDSDARQKVPAKPASSKPPAASSKAAVPDRTAKGKSKKQSSSSDSSSDDSDKESASSTTDESEHEAPPTKKAKSPPKVKKSSKPNGEAKKPEHPIPAVESASTQVRSRVGQADSDTRESTSSPSAAERDAYKKRPAPKQSSTPSAAPKEKPKPDKQLQAETKKTAKKTSTKKDTSKPVSSSQPTTSKGASSSTGGVERPSFMELSKQAKQPPYKNPTRPASQPAVVAAQQESDSDSDDTTDDSSDEEPTKDAANKGASRFASLTGCKSTL